MNIDFINSLVDHRRNLDEIINDAKIQLAHKNTGFSHCTCESLVNNGSNSVCFNEMLTGIIFPQSLVIVCTNDNSVHNKKVKIHKDDIILFLKHCNNHEIRVAIELPGNASSVAYVKLICRYIEMNDADFNAYKEKFRESMIAGEFREPLN